MVNNQTDSPRGDILIVDDDLSGLNTLSSILTNQGYEVRGVPDGPMALTVIDSKPPELVLLDVKMPGMDGFEVCRQIKANEKASGIPVLFLSALDETADKVKGFNAGGLDFISKPFQAEEVLARVDTHLALSRLTKNLEEQISERTAEIKQFKHIVESTNNPIGLVDRNFVYQYLNEPYCQAFKKSINEIIGHSVTELFGRNFFETVMEPHYKKCFAGENVNYQEWFDFPGWGRRYMDARYYPFRGADGRVTAVVTNVHDITDIKELDVKLKASEERFRTFMDHNPASIYIKDENDIHVYANPAAFKDANKKPEEFIGATTRDLWPPKIADRLIELDRKVLYEDIPRTTEEWGDEQTGETKWRRDIKFPIKLESGKKLLGGIALDITEVKRAEQTLAEQLEFEMLIAGIAAQLAMTGPEQLDEMLNSVLQALGRLLRTERAFLSQFTHDGKSLYHRSIWVDEGIEVPPQLFEMDFAEDSPWLAQQLRLGKVINTDPGLTGLPDESGDLRKSLQKGGIKSGVVVPVRVEGRTIGSLGLDTLDQPREYSPPLVDRLKIVADMMGTTLRRVRSQEILHDQLQFEDLISKLSATFINIKASEIDNSIENALQLIVEFLEIESGNLYQFSRDLDLIPLTHSFNAKGVKNSPLLKLFDQQLWLTQKIRKKEMFYFSHPMELPEDAQADKEYLMKQGIKSALIFPLEAAGAIHGALAFSSLKRERQWPEQFIKKFTFLSEVISNALLRKRADEKISEAFKEIRQLKDRLEQENIYLREEIQLHHRHEEIIGKSKPMLEMLARAEQVAETDATVLILGETGTGKELLARSIHKLSPRKNRQMIKVNCAALPATLIESELFGREKGAYTGAMSRQIGRFEIADGSTLFLDEIGEMPQELQAKLLRVLQEGQFERLGSPETVTTDVRIITSTNRDLARAVREGKFREDLYYRLNVFSVTAPPLRDRVDDIPMLVWAFVKEFESSMGKNIHKISKKDLDALQKYPWPGNIRELKNVVENAMIISRDKTLYINPPVDPSVKVQKALKLEDVERNHIKDVLKNTS